jgi:hypothetical protein
MPLMRFLHFAMPPLRRYAAAAAFHRCRHYFHFAFIYDSG